MAFAKKKNTELPKLKRQIQEDVFERLYIFYGEETYLKEHYIKAVLDKIPDNGFEDFNHITVDGAAPLSELDDVWESFPMMAPRRLVVIKNSNIFKIKNGPNEETKAFWQEKLQRTAEDTVVIFCEDSVDKRSVLYKTAVKNGIAVEFCYRDESELVTYVTGRALKAGKKLDKSLAAYLVSRCDEGMMNLVNELEKLFDYCGNEITKTDIDRVVSKGINVSAFELTNGIMEHDASKAMEILADLKTRNESAFPILYLIYSNASKLLKTKLMQGESADSIAKAIGTGSFIARKYIESARRFDEPLLIKMLVRIPEIDLDIKRGMGDEWTLLEQYVTECLYVWK
ncbi:MAG: DNA polymerase III subunit delta [Clostridiales bacterium]|nr:DNA polymerase III subunit delta [Clostridiales bacterium]